MVAIFAGGEAGGFHRAVTSTIFEDGNDLRFADSIVIDPGFPGGGGFSANASSGRYITTETNRNYVVFETCAILRHV